MMNICPKLCSERNESFHTEQYEELLTHSRPICIAKVKVFWDVTPLNFVNTDISVKSAAPTFRVSEL
jgi:hypothetical protein